MDNPSIRLYIGTITHYSRHWSPHCFWMSPLGLPDICVMTLYSGSWTVCWTKSSLKGQRNCSDATVCLDLRSGTRQSFHCAACLLVVFVIRRSAGILIGEQWYSPCTRIFFRLADFSSLVLLARSTRAPVEESSFEFLFVPPEDLRVHRNLLSNWSVSHFRVTGCEAYKHAQCIIYMYINIFKQISYFILCFEIIWVLLALKQ